MHLLFGMNCTIRNEPLTTLACHRGVLRRAGGPAERAAGRAAAAQRPPGRGAGQQGACTDDVSAYLKRCDTDVFTKVILFLHSYTWVAHAHIAGVGAGAASRGGRGRPRRRPIQRGQQVRLVRNYFQVKIEQ